MIVTTLKCLNRYRGLSTPLDKAIAFLGKMSLEQMLALPPGRSEVCEDFFLLRQSYQIEIGRNSWEYHQRYLDIQIILSGRERFGYLNSALAGDLSPKGGFDPQADIAKFSPTVAQSAVLLTAGEVAIVFPEDYHLPKIAVDNKQVEKLVVKVRL